MAGKVHVFKDGHKNLTKSPKAKLFQEAKFFVIIFTYLSRLVQGLLNRWTSQLDLGCTTEGLERVVSVHNST